MTNRPEALNNATVIVVGASSGFGREVALKAAREGANVVVAARRTDMLKSLVEEITASGGKAMLVTADVSNPEDIDAITKNAIDRYGPIDVWINNVGVGALGYFWDIPIEDHSRVVDVNLKGLIYGAHAALKQFIKQGGGTLVNVGSIDSEVPLALQNTYAATKSAVLSLSKSLNEELRLSGRDDTIKVATIMPWAVDTPWWAHAANYTGHKARMASMDDPEIVVDAIIEACTNPKEKTPVGAKAKLSNFAHQIMPKAAELMSAKTAKKESKKADSLPPTTGAIYKPMNDGAKIDGGIRKRMKKEDESND